MLSSTSYLRGVVSALFLLALSSSHGVSRAIADSSATSQGMAKVAPAPPVCDGTTDDSGAMQQWLDYAASTRTTFVVPSTVAGCKITKPLKVQSNTHVVQHGRVFAAVSGYAIPSGESAESGMYTIVDGARDVVIEGAGKLDGMSEPQAAGIATAGTANGGFGSDVADVSLLGLTIENMDRAGVSIGGTAGIRLDGLTVRSSAKGVEIGRGTARAIATNLRISEIANDGFAFLNGAVDSSLSSSIVHDCTGIGVRALTAAGVAATNRDLLIDNNIVYASAIGVQTLSEGSAPSSVGINVTSNQLHGNRQYGVGLLACENCQATSNLSHLNGSSPYGYQPGIFVSNSRGIKLSANTLRNEGQGTTTGYGVVLQDVLSGRAASQRIVVTGNFIYDDQTPKTMFSVIGGTLANPVVITGNVFGPGLSGISAALCASPSICTNNQVMP
jgi:hypothetical protein